MEGGGRREEGFSLTGCCIDKGKSKVRLDRDNKIPGISPYRTPAEKWISVYLFRCHSSSRQGRYHCFLPTVVCCQNAGHRKQRDTNSQLKARGYYAGLSYFKTDHKEEYK